MNSLERRVKAQERRLLPPSGRELLIVTPEEYDAMVRDACERVLASLPDERTRALVDAVLGAKHRALVQKAFHELNLPLRPTNYREWPPGTAFMFVVAPREAASFEEWLEIVPAIRRRVAPPLLNLKAPLRGPLPHLAPQQRLSLSRWRRSCR